MEDRSRAKDVHAISAQMTADAKRNASRVRARVRIGFRTNLESRLVAMIYYGLTNESR